MGVHPLAGRPVPREALANIARLVSAYYTTRVERDDPSQRVAFGTSGHRGSSLKGSFTEGHILAITQAICDYRSSQGIYGPLFLGMDTHALSEPAHRSALEVLAANGVQVRIHPAGGFTPTPVISHAILAHNRAHPQGLADGIVITPSHNPPEDGGFKYNPPQGGPADTTVTTWIAARANALLKEGGRGVKRLPYARAISAETTREHDYVRTYVEDLKQVVDLEAIRASGLKLGADALGGASLAFWGAIAERYGLHLEVLHDAYDPTFAFMCADWDGKIRMDCSSPYAMAGLIALRDRYDIAFGTDPDADRHGIVTPSAGLMNPNHFLSVAIDHLFATRPAWPLTAAVGKTLVRSSVIDHVASRRGRGLVEVPVGFKWFVDGLLAGSLGFGGEESAGAAFLRFDGQAWSTDKDGIIMALLAGEITAKTGRDPARHYAELEGLFGECVYERIDAPATPAQKAVLSALIPADFPAQELAGDRITTVMTSAPGNGAPLGGLKVVTPRGWFAARPSGTEDIYKIYAESSAGERHLRLIQEEAQSLIAKTFALRGV